MPMKELIEAAEKSSFKQSYKNLGFDAEIDKLLESAGKIQGKMVALYPKLDRGELYADWHERISEQLRSAKIGGLHLLLSKVMETLKYDIENADKE